MADRTNWVTVKIPETVRDAAREDNRTYAEIMQDGLSEIDTQNSPNADLDIDALGDSIRDQLSMANEPGVQLDVDQLFNQLDTLEGRLKDLETQVDSLRTEVQAR